MLVACISCDVEVRAPPLADDRRNFFLSTQTLHACLKHVTATQTLHLSRNVGEHEFTIRMTEPPPSHASTVPEPPPSRVLPSDPRAVSRSSPCRP
jgi:hypothetical protein